jgi:glyceraldehyde 3-phosphate dehydrogenase
MVGGTAYKVFSERDPAQLPWGDSGIDIVFECTGVFTMREDLEKHIRAGAKYVILSAPSKSEDVATVVHGVNQGEGEAAQIVSLASCTTNSITPVVEIVGRRIGLEKAIMTTIHAYTSSQSLVDAPNKRVRRGRAAAANFVPTSTGAAIATTRALPQYEGRFDGVAVRGPVTVGSLADIVFMTERETTVEEVNRIFKEEAKGERYKGILGVSEDPLVSSDIIKDPRASIVDLGMTQVVDGNLVKVMSWYDNEWGYTNQMIREAVRIAALQAG